jgi:TonB family protein
MKAVSKSVLVFSLGVLSSIAASAMTSEQFYIASCRKDPGVPVPIEVVSPRVGPEYEGSTVRLEFTVDEMGKPTDIVVKSARDYTVGSFVSQAVSQWRFRPATLNGVTVARKVELPVMIVKQVQTAALVAAN